MDAISLLMEEHQVILRALDALDAFAAEVSRGGGDPAELERFVRFIRAFADARHHGKEEDILFAAMVRAGFPREGGPIAVMLMDHDAGRAHVAAMARHLGGGAPWTAADRAEVVAATGGYTDLLRSHIMKEDQILYPMAQHRLPEAVMEQVDLDCETFEARQVASGADALKDLARELVQRHAA
jgi:hemerythrin-like domain-containing protein